MAFRRASVNASPITSSSTDARCTLVHPARPQAPLSGVNIPGCSAMNSRCCSGVSVTMPNFSSAWRVAKIRLLTRKSGWPMCALSMTPSRAMTIRLKSAGRIWGSYRPVFTGAVNRHRTCLRERTNVQETRSDPVWSLAPTAREPIESVVVSFFERVGGRQCAPESRRSILRDATNAAAIRNVDRAAGRSGSGSCCGT